MPTYQLEPHARLSQRNASCSEHSPYDKYTNKFVTHLKLESLPVSHLGTIIVCLSDPMVTTQIGKQAYLIIILLNHIKYD